LPLYRSQRKWSDGSRVTLDLPLFPGYLFVHIKRTERVRVLDVPGTLAVVAGRGGNRWPCRTKPLTPCARAFTCGGSSRILY
jgi:hypothetical protein